MRTIEWKIKSGATAKVTISLDKKEETFRDDFMGEIKKEGAASTWSIRYGADVEGHGDVNGLCHSPSTDNLPDGCVGRIGNLCYNQEIEDQISDAVAEIENSVDWKKHLEAKSATGKADREYYEHTQKMKKGMGE